jgi:hypothetical protein
VLSISPMWMSAVWRLTPVWAKEAHDGGYGRSRLSEIYVVV